MSLVCVVGVCVASMSVCAVLAGVCGFTCVCGITFVETSKNEIHIFENFNFQNLNFHLNF